jgi:hypothetical protein
LKLIDKVEAEEVCLDSDDEDEEVAATPQQPRQQHHQQQQQPPAQRINSFQMRYDG